MRLNLPRPVCKQRNVYVGLKCIRSFHSRHNVVDRGVLQAMWCVSAKMDTVINSFSANHAYLKTLWRRIP